jgi:hypothetical protein
MFLISFYGNVKLSRELVDGTARDSKFFRSLRRVPSRPQQDGFEYPAVKVIAQLKQITLGCGFLLAWLTNE